MGGAVNNYREHPAMAEETNRARANGGNSALEAYATSANSVAHRDVHH